LVLYGKTDAQLRVAADRAAAEILRLNRLLSNYSETSEWSHINALAARQAVTASPEVFALLERCVEYSRASGGSFDISVGALMKVWGFYKGSGRLPQPDEVALALDQVGYQHILLDHRTRTVRFDRDRLELDPGGIGKGYAVDRVVAVLKASGVRSALISAGGSSIFAIGRPPDESRGWKTLIEDPRGGPSPAAVVYLRNESLSTSGTSEKFFTADGKRYSHIMDPRSGYPAQGSLSVSVIAARTTDSEAWTKPVFIAGRKWKGSTETAKFRIFLCSEAGTQSNCEWLSGTGKARGNLGLAGLP
jgi:thiamine biosynthesis lipoprotein